jgi:hypothetical protein
MAPVAMLASSPAGAAVCASYTAVAAADGARTAVSSPGFLVVERADGGAPAAQAIVDSLGTSTAYAGYPYPGDTAMSLLPIAGAPRGTYPLTAESSFPAAPASKRETPAVTLTATSAYRTSSANAQAGASGQDKSSAGLTQARASVGCAETGEITAASENKAESLDFVEGTLRVGRVRSFAKVVIDAAGRPNVESDLEVTGATVAGQTVSFTGDGLVIGSGATALPETPLSKVLDDAGIKVTYVAAHRQEDGQGVVAPALQIQMTREVVGGAPTVVTYTFGRAFASASAAAGTGVSSGSDTSGIPPGDGSSSVGTGAPSAAASASAAAPSPGPPSSASAAQDEASGQGGSGRAVPIRSVSPFSSWSIYAVLLVSATVLFSCGLLFKTIGVRLRWV